MSGVRPLSLEDDSALARICMAIGVTHCPYIPTAGRECRLSTLELVPGAGLDGERKTFLAILAAVKSIRTMASVPAACVIIVAEPEGREDGSPADFGEAVDWPYWVARCAFAGRGVMIGRFGRSELDRVSALPVPAAWHGWVVLRNSVPSRDPALATKSPKSVQDAFAGGPPLAVPMSWPPEDYAVSLAQFSILREWSAGLMGGQEEAPPGPPAV